MVVPVAKLVDAFDLKSNGCGLAGSTPARNIGWNIGSAQVAELVDAPDSKSGGANRAGSIPALSIE